MRSAGSGVRGLRRPPLWELAAELWTGVDSGARGVGGGGAGVRLGPFALGDSMEAERHFTLMKVTKPL